MSDDSLEARIDRLESARQIENNISKYYFAFDRRNLDDLLESWHDECRLEVSDGVHEGKEGIAHYARDIVWTRRIQTHHWTANRIIEVNGDEADVRMHMQAWTQSLNQGWNRVALTNNDKWVRVDGKWLLKDRVQPVHNRVGVPVGPTH